MNKEKYKKMSKTKIIILTFIILLAACSSNKKKSYEEYAFSGRTTRTENMLTNLTRFTQKGVIIGQVYGTIQGIGWSCDSARSDINSICNDNPAVVSYELAGIESGKKQNKDNLPFTAIKKNVIDFFHHGGLVIMNWTCPENATTENMLKEEVKQVAYYLNSLEDGYGFKVPVILNIMPIDGKSWYCKLNKEEYNNLYKEIKDLLEDYDVKSIVWGYSETYKNDNSFLKLFTNEAEVINVSYTANNTVKANDYSNNLKQILSKAVSFAQDNNKPIGLTTGIEGIPYNNFFSETLLPIIKQYRLSYLMFGRNYGEYKDGHFFTPYPGENNDIISDFITFYNDESTIFRNKLNGLYLK